MVELDSIIGNYIEIRENEVFAIIEKIKFKFLYCVYLQHYIFAGHFISLEVQDGYKMQALFFHLLLKYNKVSMTKHLALQVLLGLGIIGLVLG